LFLQGPSYISSAKERLAGFCKALKEYQVPFDPSLIVEVPLLNEGLAGKLSKIMDDRYTAIFAFSDMIAWEAWAYLHKKGLRVPQDKSLIGFDHIQSRMILPFSLNSISSYKGKVSMFTMEILLKRMQGDTSSPSKLVIDTTLCEGETVMKV
jgi:LacI family transcriptional regulator